MIKVRVVNESKHELPKYATEGDAGMDLRADLNEDIVMGPLERVVVPTGIKIQLPVGFEAQVRPRSGLAAKFGITVLNSPGTIDSTYTGVIGVILINLSQDAFVVKDGDRIAQLVVAKHECVDWDEREVLEITERGDGGFGHTGVS